MLKLTLEADYALRMILLLSLSAQKLDAKALSSEMKVPLRFALKILRTLCTSGIIRSVKGAGGGYILALPPEEISLRAVIEAIEGPIRINRCLDDSSICERVPDKDDCPLHNSFDKINKSLAAELDQIKFDSLIY